MLLHVVGFDEQVMDSSRNERRYMLILNRLSHAAKLVILAFLHNMCNGCTSNGWMWRVKLLSHCYLIATHGGPIFGSTNTSERVGARTTNARTPFLFVGNPAHPFFLNKLSSPEIFWFLALLHKHITIFTKCSRFPTLISSFPV